MMENLEEKVAMVCSSISRAISGRKEKQAMDCASYTKLEMANIILIATHVPLTVPIRTAWSSVKNIAVDIPNALRYGVKSVTAPIIGAKKTTYHS